MHGLLCFAILEVLLVVGLDSNYVPGLLVNSPSNDCECTLADFDHNLKLAHIERLLIRVLCTAGVNQVAEVPQRDELLLGILLGLS